jgi:hypothetical protein
MKIKIAAHTRSPLNTSVMDTTPEARLHRVRKFGMLRRKFIAWNKRL